MLKAFREHLAALSEPALLDLLAIAEMNQISNADVRKILRLRTRGSAWRWLRRLSRIKMLEKRGNGYRTSTYGRELVSTLSSVFKAAMRGRWAFVDGNHEASARLLEIAEEGTEKLYERGLIDEEEYRSRSRLIRDFKAHLAQQETR